MYLLSVCCDRIIANKYCAISCAVKSSHRIQKGNFCVAPNLNRLHSVYTAHGVATAAPRVPHLRHAREQNIRLPSQNMRCCWNSDCCGCCCGCPAPPTSSTAPTAKQMATPVLQPPSTKPARRPAALQPSSLQQYVRVSHTSVRFCLCPSECDLIWLCGTRRWVKEYQLANT